MKPKRWHTRRPPRITRFGWIGATMVALIATGLEASLGGAVPQPTYDSDETRTIVERLIEAHGGIEPWRNATAVAYEHVMFMPKPPQGHSVWALHTEVVDQRTRRSYQEYPLTGARLANDGDRLWSSDWGGPSPPRMMSMSAFYFTFIPWLTQDQGVHLEAADPSEIPEWEREVDAVRMSFEGGGDTFVLLIDRETGLLSGLRLFIGDRRILDQFGVPESVDRIPGPTHAFRTFGEISGLTVPLEYHTRGPDGSTIGYHVMSNIDLNAEFDEARLEAPADAEFVR